MKIKRIVSPSVDEFQKQYLVSNIPVIVVNEMEGWKGRTLWTPEYFYQAFGSEATQIYDDLFNLLSVETIGSYLNKYFNRSNINKYEKIPYARWYTKFKDCEYAWADKVFNKIKDQWSAPSFLPNTSYILPYCTPPSIISPTNSLFPARGLFISAKGARTRLHCDPWCSDAVLCQIFGKKEVTLYSPTQQQYLCN